MTEYVSGASTLSFARESAYGIVPAAFGGSGGQSQQQFIGIANDGFTAPDTANEVRTYYSLGNGRIPFKQRLTRKSHSGNITIVPHNGTVFAYGLGQETMVATGVHLLESLPGPILPSATVGIELIGAPSLKRLFKGFVFDTLDISCRVGEELKVGASVMAKETDSSSTETFTAFNTDGPARAPFMFSDVRGPRSVEIGGDGYDPISGEFAQPGRKYTRVEGFSSRIGNGLSAKYYLGDSREPFNYLTRRNEFSATLDIVPAGANTLTDTDALYDLLEQESDIGDVLIPFEKQSSGITDQMDFLLEDCVVESGPHNLPDSLGEVVVPFAIKPRNIKVVSRDGLGAYLS